MFHVERATTGGKTEAMEEVFHVEQNRPAVRGLLRRVFHVKHLDRWLAFVGREDRLVNGVQVFLVHIESLMKRKKSANRLMPPGSFQQPQAIARGTFHVERRRHKNG